MKVKRNIVSFILTKKVLRIKVDTIESLVIYT